VRRLGLALALCLAAALPAGGARGADPLDGPGLKAHLASLADLLAQREGGAIPTLTDGDHAKLATGKAVLKEHKDGELIRGTVFRVAETEAWRIWLALSDNDHHEDFMPYVREGAVLEQAGGTKLAYQYLEMPAVKHRHLITRARDNGALWQASGKTIWESVWWLEPDSEDDVAGYIERGLIQHVTAEEAAEAIFTPANDGYWLLVELPDGRTLIVYQTFSDIGGKVPAFVVNEFGPQSMDKLTRVIETRGQAIESVFSSAAAAPPAPDGSPVEQLR